MQHLEMANDTITRIRATQAPLQRTITKRQVKPPSDSGILRAQDANRSIRTRKAKEAATEKRRLDRQWEKMYGHKSQAVITQESEASLEAARAALEAGASFSMDTQLMR